MPEPAFHVGPNVGLERSAARADHVVYGRALLLHQAGDAGIAGNPLQPEHTFGPEDVQTACADPRPG